MKPIPKLKRDRYTFISNLQDITANPEHPITFKRDGYLLSEHYSNPKLVELAMLVKKRRNLLISDNGNFTRMKSIASKFEKEGDVLLTKALDEEDKLGIPTPATLLQRDKLIVKIELACANGLAAMDMNEVIAGQLNITPHYLIGLEDFTIPVLMICGLTHPVFNPKAEKVAVYQAQTAKLYQSQRSGKFGSKKELANTHKFLVLHAYDYESAFQGSTHIPSINPDGVAISFGGPMKSKRYITSLDFGEVVETFDEKLPEPYLISTALTLGVANGAKSDVPVHILGVGSPILIALIGQLLKQSRAISIDSTAPFKDANAGKLYGSQSAFLKMDMYKVAAYALVDNQPFNSNTPFFKKFEHDFPSNWAALRAELGVTSASSIKSLAATLEKQKVLTERYIPFFAKMRSGNDEMMTRLRMDRAGHNYWVLKNICISVRNRIHDPKRMEKWMQYQVNRYKEVGSDKWSKATEASFELSKKYLNA